MRLGFIELLKVGRQVCRQKVLRALWPHCEQTADATCCDTFMTVLNTTISSVHTRITELESNSDVTHRHGKSPLYSALLRHTEIQ